MTTTTTNGAASRTGRPFAAGNGLTLTTGQVARLCNLSPGTINKWADKGLIPCHRLPPGDGSTRQAGDRRFLRADVLAFMHAAGMPVPAALGPSETPAPLVLPVLLVASASPRPPWLTVPDGWLVEVAPTLSAAGRAFREREPTAVILDCSLGRQACLAVAEWLKGAEAYVVLLPCDDEMDAPTLDRACDLVLVPGVNLAGFLAEVTAP